MKPRRLYTSEFKTQALELLATGKPVPELAQELCISTSLLYNWRAGCGICGAIMPAFRWRMTF